MYSPSAWCGLMFDYKLTTHVLSGRLSALFMKMFGTVRNMLGMCSCLGSIASRCIMPGFLTLITFQIYIILSNFNSLFILIVYPIISIQNSIKYTNEISICFLLLNITILFPQIFFADLFLVLRPTSLYCFLQVVYNLNSLFFLHSILYNCLLYSFLNIHIFLHKGSHTHTNGKTYYVRDD